MTKNFGITGVAGFVAPRHLKAICETGNTVAAAADVSDSVGILDRFGYGIRGICLGAQLMTRRSEEGQLSGLGWIDAETIRFSLRPPFRVPHMGWTEIAVRRDSLFLRAGDPQRFYFVHSYHFRCARNEDVPATARYGEEFVAAFSHDNVFGVQFHSEKSHKSGMTFLRRFADA